MTRRFVARRLVRHLAIGLLAGFPLSIAAAVPVHALDRDVATAFVDTAVHDVYASMAGKHLSPAERSAVLDSVIHRYVNIERTSEALVGPIWGKSPPADQTAFENTLVAYMLAMWSEPLGEISPGQKIVITGAVANGDRVLVRSAATAPHENPIYLDWTVESTSDGRPFIADVSVEGVSLIRVMRSDFSSVLAANSERLDGLIAGMRRKIGSLN